MPVTLEKPLPKHLQEFFVNHASKLWKNVDSYAAPGTGSLLPILSLYDNLPFLEETKYFAFFSYRSCKIRVTISAPKNLTGAFAVGWFPYTRQYYNSSGNTFYANTNALTSTSLFTNIMLARKDTKVLSLAEPVDVMFEIPWPYAFSFIPIEYIYNLSSWTSDADTRPEIGEPVFWYNVMTMTSHTDTPASLNIITTIQYEGLKVFGRIDEVTDTDTTQHLHMYSAAANIATGAVKAAVAAKLESKVKEVSARMVDGGFEVIEDQAESILCKYMGYCELEDQDVAPEVDTVGEHQSEGAPTLDQPAPVMTSIIGDTLSSVPAVSIGLRAPYKTLLPRTTLRPASSTMINEFIRRPQLVYSGTFNGTASSNSLLCRPNFEDLATFPTWLGYFGQVARYWRGSLRYNFVFFGHPAIEARFALAYSPYSHSDVSTYGFQGTPYYESYTTNFSGSKTFSILIPYVNQMEYLPLDRDDGVTMPPEYSIGRLAWKVQVISSFFNTISALDYMIFVSAGPDFAFYDPAPPGLYNTLVDDTFLKGKDKKKKRQKLQCSLPGVPDPISMMKTYSTADPGIFRPIKTLRTLGANWSRSVKDITQSARFPVPSFGNGTPYVGSTWPDNDIFAECDYVSYISNMFLYWRGSIGFKTVWNPNYVSSTHADYAYVSLGEPYSTPLTYTVIQPDPSFPLSNSQANWGGGTITTKTSEQPVLEFTVPMRHALGVSFVHADDSPVPNDYSRYGYLPPSTIYSNILATVTVPGPPPVTTEVDLIYRKIGPDFELFFETLMPFPAEWATRGFAKA